jgi:hypothetical protein
MPSRPPRQRAYTGDVDILSLMRERSGDYDCPKCGLSLKGCALEMLRDDDPQFTVQVTCAACHIRFIVVLQVRDRMREDQADEPVPIPAGPPPPPPIGADELLDVHEMLRDHNGSLLELFSRERAEA